MARVAVLLLLLVTACGERVEYGGLTAALRFEDQAGTLRRSLRAAEVPLIVDRLQIVALAADGSTLTDALGNVVETNLVATPGTGQAQLSYEGGEWELARVPAGEDRIILASAYLGQGVDPRVSGQIAFQGRLEGISVLAGETRDAGTLVLRSTGIKIPEVDMTPPAAPNPVQAEPIAKGEALRVTFGRPKDAEGFLLAVTSSTGISPPMLAQQSAYLPGDELVPGLTVHSVWPLNGPTIVDVEGLLNGVPYTVMVYAFDVDLDGMPLNYSPAATDSDIPRDTLAPGMITGLAVGPSGNGATIAFYEPTEDDGEPNAGVVASYDVRASNDRSALTNPDLFETLATVMPPQPIEPGRFLSFERSFAALGVAPDQPFFVGIRARDAATNTGEIAVAEFTATATEAPTIETLVPEIAIASREITIRGDNFGVAPGTVTLSTTGTASEDLILAITRWDNSTAVVTVPSTARSGQLTLMRPDGPSVARFLPVVLQIDTAIADYEPPFEIVGAVAPDGSVIAALYREAGDFSDFESAVERFYGLVPEEIPLAPLTVDPHSVAVAGTYSRAYDRFLFVASTDMLTMSTVFVTSSTLAPDAQRLVNGVGAGNVDRVSVVFLDGGTGVRYPALLAFSVSGAIRTATVTDALVQQFNAFYATTSTFAAFDRVAIQRNNAGDVLMAHRSTVGATSELALRINTEGGAPDRFVPVPTALPLVAGPNLEIVSASTGADEDFVVAFETTGANGRTEVRLLPLSTYGLWGGYPPLPAITSDRRLEDVGLIEREGETWIALLTTSQTGLASSELNYTEVPYSAINMLTRPGSHPGVALDIASDDTRGRLACKPLLAQTCPMVWSGENAQVFFVRR